MMTRKETEDMIIRETKDSFIMIRQDDHARLSGYIAKNFSKEILASSHFFEDVITAACQHDRGWIGLDETPVLNDRSKVPYSFSDYPLLPKLAFYRIGLDEIEEMNQYAGLLCSMHFCSFFSQSKDENCIEFLHYETKRQMKIKKKLSDIEEPLLQQHFRLLQFSDDLSLYLCLNEPGADKKNEHPWFQRGFKNTEIFHPQNKQLNARWKNASEVIVAPFLFTKEFHVVLPFKSVSKKAIVGLGVAEAYEKSAMRQQKFSFLKA
ncbi:DUF3891 family protein [Bacillus salacetis]|uniref:DUF3891 family protein n=1 Tax=Bacillus salacetis TaxID=2315464 RepID=UPI003BA0F024